MLGIILRGRVQLPAEQWGTELEPFNDIEYSNLDWDVIEDVAERLGVAMQNYGDKVCLYLDDDNKGEFTNTTIGVEMALQFLKGVA